ncbi:MAG: adenosylcobinamide-GDP ribazoletransferase [Pseudonocardiaceae bacterium]
MKQLSSSVSDPLWMSVGTLTALPVPAPGTTDARVAGRAMLLAPLAALPLAVLACGVVAVAALIDLPPLVSAAIAVAAVGLSSRGLHLDGLADTADGLGRAGRSGPLGGSYDRARALEIMRKGDVGPMGVATLVLVLLAQVAALSGAIAAGHGVFAAAAAVLVSRLVLAGCCAQGVPAARKEGLGGTVAGSVRRWQAAAALAVGAVLVSLGALAADLTWWRGAIAALVGIAGAAVLLARCVQRLGGITGDVLGGCVEAAALGVLLSLAA